MKRYEITLQEYYNIVIYGDINYTPLCPICGNSNPFINLRVGYYETCSNSCHISKRNYENWTSEEYRAYHCELNQRTINGLIGRINQSFLSFFK